jgi:transcription elongation factor GreA
MDQPMKPVQVTQAGFDQLKAEYDELVNVKRPHVVARLERARGEGDLAENSDYTSAKDELEFLDGRIEELKNVVENAVIVSDVSTKNSSTVSLGTTVTVEVNGKKYEYKIVGEWEADPLNKKISHESPLGQALLDKKVGENVEVEAPAGKVNYVIVSIN